MRRFLYLVGAIFHEKTACKPFFGVASPIVSATKATYLDDAAHALSVRLTAEDITSLEASYLPYRIVGAIDQNPADGVILLDEKK